jgi:hypothetical protein
MPWYSALDSLDTLLVGRQVGMMHIVCYLRQGSRVFETYWTTRRGVEGVGQLRGVALGPQAQGDRVVIPAPGGLEGRHDLVYACRHRPHRHVRRSAPPTRHESSLSICQFFQSR